MVYATQINRYNNLHIHAWVMTVPFNPYTLLCSYA